MAKLSAYGRTEVYRIVRHNIKMTLMSDGVALVNYGYGWKRASLKSGSVLGRPGNGIQTPEDWLRFYESHGWRRIA